jgi:hypothetical protein
MTATLGDGLAWIAPGKLTQCQSSPFHIAPTTRSIKNSILLQTSLLDGTVGLWHVRVLVVEMNVIVSSWMKDASRLISNGESEGHPEFKLESSSHICRDRLPRR